MPVILNFILSLAVAEFELSAPKFIRNSNTSILVCISSEANFERNVSVSVNISSSDVPIVTGTKVVNIWWRC